MKVSDVYPSKSPIEPAEDHRGVREECRIVEVHQDTIFSPDGSEDSYLYAVVDSKRFAKAIKINKTCARMLAGEYSSETDNWVGKDVIISTQHYPKFNAVGWIIEPNWQAGDEQRKQHEQAQLDDDKIPF